jgi:aromatic-L-amino-acid decarboxylase
VPLGRRFRALKLWFLLRAYGLEGLRAMIRNHVAWAEGLCTRLAALEGVEIVTPPILSLFTFRLTGASAATGEALTQRALTKINDRGRIYLTQTRIDGTLVIRFQAGSWSCTEADVEAAYQEISETVARLRG